MHVGIFSMLISVAMLFIILALVHDTDKRHISRMKRIVNIQKEIGLGDIYGEHKSNIITKRGIVFVSFYAILFLICFSTLLYKVILFLV